MAVHGYITHAAHNRRYTALLFAAYMVAFQLIAVFVLTWFLLMFDHEHTVLSNPHGYALRYAFPVALATGLVFWRLYRGHASTVARALDVKIVDRAEEPRFVAIGEEQCTALGVRAPRFGVIEAAEPNALAVGEGRNGGLIAVTRGLLELLDDDELAAVLAHEASHIRNGDTKVLAANHALMRTAVILQTHNILRIEDWRQLLIPLALPAMLPLFLVSGGVTQASLRLARFARRGLKLTRDHVADGEAVRVTHFPEALIGALRKVSGRGGFAGSERFEAMLFDGQADHEGGSHPSTAERIAAIGSLGAGLMAPGRVRRDTRAMVPGGPGRFGRRLGAAEAAARAARRVGAAKPVEPEKPTFAMLMLVFTDRERFWRWQNASIDALEWRADEARNWFGLKPNLVLPTLAVAVATVAIHWPADNNLESLARAMGPGALVEMARELNANDGMFCAGQGCAEAEAAELELRGRQ